MESSVEENIEYFMVAVYFLCVDNLHRGVEKIVINIQMYTCCYKLNHMYAKSVNPFIYW